LKNKFFAKIAHEFKTPINSILGLINKIKINLELLNKENQDINANINQVEHLSNYIIFLVHDIIDYSNNIKKHGSLNFKNEKLNIVEIISFCNCILETLLISKGKENSIKNELIIEDILYHEDFYVNSDNFRIQQILLNFISNSVKFTKSGFIKIKTSVKFLNSKSVERIISKNPNKLFDLNEISILEKKFNNNVTKKVPYLIISVVDTGMGMNEIELKNIFDQKKNFLKKDYNLEGSGLGLSIVKYLANALNHSLMVNSEFFKGSEFSLILKCNFSEIINFDKIETFYSHRKLENNLFKNEIIIEEKDTLNNTCSNLLMNYHDNYKKDIDFSSINEKEEEIVMAENKSSFNSGWSTKTNKLEELNFYINKEEIKFLDINFFTSRNKKYFRNYSATQEEVDFISNGIDNLEISDLSIVSNGKEEFKISNFDKTSINRTKSFKDEIENSKNPSFSNVRIIKEMRINDELKIHETLVSNDFYKESLISNNLSKKKNSGKSVNVRLSPNSLKYPKRYDHELKNSFKKQEEFQDLNRENKYYFNNNDHIFKSIKESITPCYLNPKSNDSYNKINKKSIIHETLIKIKINKILIIDDHKLIRESLVFLIKKALKNLKMNNYFEIIEGCDGVDMLNFLIKYQTKENEIKCIFTDENMEYINGS